jgi:hypothetical protein
MKKFFLGTIFFLISMISYSEIKDNINLFTEEQATQLNEKIKKIESEQGVTFYVTTYPDEESFIPTNLEKVIVINLNKNPKDDIMKIQLKFTPDLNMEEAEEEINEILDEAAPLIETEKNSEYILNVIQGFEKILSEKKEVHLQDNPILPEVEIEENIVEIPQKKNNTSRYIITGMIVIIFLAIIKILINAKSILRKK